MISSMFSRFEFLEVKRGLFVDKGSHVFSSSINSCLEQIELNPIGCRLLEKIYKLASQIFIVGGPEDCCLCSVDEPKKAFILTTLSPLVCFDTFSRPIPLPIHVILFHELVHAYHHLSGKTAKTHYSDPLVWESDEEYKTIIGFPSKKPERNRDKITENAFRFAEGLSPRFGSWTPKSVLGSNFGMLALARMHVLGMIHTDNILKKFPFKGPPEMATCTKLDLVGPTYSVIVAKIEGVNPDFSPNPLKISDCVYLNFSNDGLPSSEMESLCSLILGEGCHKIVDLELFPRTYELIEGLFPPLKTIDYTVKSMMILRLSKIEFDVLRGFPRL